MATQMRVQLTLTDMINDVASGSVSIDELQDYTEILEKRFTMGVGASDEDLTAHLQALGVDAELRMLVVISDVPGVTAKIATQADDGADNDNVATLPCYPFLAVGQSPGFDVSLPDFSLAITAPSADSAKVRVIAYR